MKNKEYIIYCHLNKINGKRYIGQTCQTLEERSHKDGSGYNTCSRFWKAIQKYGWDNFDHIILKEHLNLEQANYWEEYYIKLYHTWIEDPLCNGYNLLPGGKNHTFSEETKQIWSNQRKGRKSPRKGVTLTEDIKNKISKALKGKKTSEETIQKKRNTVNKNSKAIRCIETGKEFISLSEAARYYGLKSPSSISNVLNPNSNVTTAGRHPETNEKLHWELVNK